MKIQVKKLRLKNNNEIEMRSVTANDAADMIKTMGKIHEESWRNLNHTAQYWKDFSIEKEIEILEDFEKSDSKFMLVAVVENEIVGSLGVFGGVSEKRKHSSQIGMAILKAYTNIGLGTELLKYALEIAKEYGFHRMELTVRTYNKPGIALYEKCGFDRVGLLKDYTKIGDEFVDEYLYQMIL